jgi:hypothetical protein
LDRVILGLEENKMTADVIDVRPDRFLRALRETGSWDEACRQSGLTVDEVTQMCVDNKKFDLAQTECHLEHVEETLLGAIETAAVQAHAKLELKMSGLREAAMEAVDRRHTPENLVDDG